MSRPPRFVAYFPRALSGKEVLDFLYPNRHEKSMNRDVCEHGNPEPCGKCILRLAEVLESEPGAARRSAAKELRRLHAENERLQQINQSHEMKLSVRGYELQIEDLKAAVAELLETLKDATDAIEHWGSYSSEYFQQKWDLHSDINAARAAIARAEGKI